MRTYTNHYTRLRSGRTSPSVKTADLWYHHTQQKIPQNRRDCSSSHYMPFAITSIAYRKFKDCRQMSCLREDTVRPLAALLPLLRRRKVVSISYMFFWSQRMSQNDSIVSVHVLGHSLETVHTVRAYTFIAFTTHRALEALKHTNQLTQIKKG